MIRSTLRYAYVACCFSRRVLRDPPKVEPYIRSAYCRNSSLANHGDPQRGHWALDSVFGIGGIVLRTSLGTIHLNLEMQVGGNL
jgi:hypothetical protein